MEIKLTRKQKLQQSVQDLCSAQEDKGLCLDNLLSMALRYVPVKELEKLERIYFNDLTNAEDIEWYKNRLVTKGDK
jgi:hypothetical protein